MNCQFTSDEYAGYVLGTLDEAERNRLQNHFFEGCVYCTSEIKDLIEFWFLFAALTERLESVRASEPSPGLREKVLCIGSPPTLRGGFIRSLAREWMKVAAAIVLVVAASTASWRMAQARLKPRIAEAQARLERQLDSARELESENKALRSLVAAARNAPAVFPGREKIVSVQDPYVLRDLQRARQSQLAMSQALTEERARAGELSRRLSDTSKLLAAATRDQADADRRYSKALDAATIGKESGMSREIGDFSTKVRTLESELAKYQNVVESQKSGMEHYSRIMSLLQSHTVSLVQLRAGAENSAGVALIADDSRLAFFPANLPAPPAGRTYQLWIMRDKAPAIVSAGTFNSVGAESGIQFSNAALVAGARALAVTEEPAGGSFQPTGPRLMEGSTSKK